MKPAADQKIVIDPALLESCVRRATGREDLRLEGWQVQPVIGGAEQGSGVMRLSGEGFSAGDCLPWTMILKIIRPGPGNTASPQASHYWQREPRYYQSGIFDDLPRGLRAPECYAVLEQPGGFWLFLEDVRDLYNLPQPDHGWPVEYYRTAARCLGQFNGAYLAGKPIPQAEWIPAQWLRAYVEEAAVNIEVFFRSQDHPFFRRTFEKVSASLLRKTWDERHEMLDTLDRLPQVFCHQDAFCRNLFAECAPDGRDRLVAIDWSYAGGAALGSELSALVCASGGMGSLPYSEYPRLEALAIEGYLEGLGDAGWHGDPDLVRFVYSATSYLRYVFGALVGEATPFALDERSYSFAEQVLGASFDQVADGMAAMTAWNYEAYKEASHLKTRLNL